MSHYGNPVTRPEGTVKLIGILIRRDGAESRNGGLEK
jgi:hypothetical protein